MTPAMKEATGFGTSRVKLYCFKNSAASSSAVPPISPIMIIPVKWRVRQFYLTFCINIPSFTFSVGVFQEDGETVDKVGTVERVTTDTNAQGLTETDLGGLVDSFVGQGTGTRNDTNLATLVDVAGHDTNFALLRSNDTRAVGADKARLVLGHKSLLHADHVMLRDTFSDGNNERDFVFNSVQDGSGSAGRRDVDNRCIGLDFLNSLTMYRPIYQYPTSWASLLFLPTIKYLTDRAKDGKAQVSLASLLWRNTTDDVGAVRDSLLRVESTLFIKTSLATLFARVPREFSPNIYLFTGEALANDLGVLVDHQVPCCGLVAAGLAGKGTASKSCASRHS